MITLDVKEMNPPRKVARFRKVHYRHYDSEFGRPHPMIRFVGKYLEAYGFSVGAPIDIQFENGVITICSLPENGNS